MQWVLAGVGATIAAVVLSWIIRNAVRSALLDVLESAVTKGTRAGILGVFQSYGFLNDRVDLYEVIADGAAEGMKRRWQADTGEVEDAYQGEE